MSKLTILIASIIIAVALVLGYVAFVKPETTAPVQPTPVPTITPIASPISEPTSTAIPSSTTTPFPSSSNTSVPTLTPDDVSEIDTSDQKVYEVADISNKFFIIENNKIPYNTYPDIIHILDNLNNKLLVSIKTNILPEKRSSYKLIGERVYFFNRDDKTVEWIDFEGSVYKLDFTRVGNWIYSEDFIISSDGQKIVWTETNSQAVETRSKLISADLDGKNKKILLEKNFTGEKYLKPIRWSNSSKDIYFTEQQGELGGYIIFGGPTNLSKINIYTNKIENIFDKDGYVGDISPNEEYISYFNGKMDNPKLIIINLKTKEESIFNIPIKENFRGGGRSYFSPDNKYLAYNIAHWDPNNEYYRVVVASSTGKEQKTIVDFQKAYQAEGWISSDKILLRDFDYNIYTVNFDGSSLKKIKIAK